MIHGAIEEPTYPGSYRGRFAPTPSGPLHLGSLLTALASYLQARSRKGQWLLRIDDLDGPRNVPGAEKQILEQLAAHGLQWDETPRRQTQHLAQYQAALGRLQSQGLLYACACTRAQLRVNNLQGPDDAVYAGTCRGLSVSAMPQALRIKADAQSLCFDDLALGRQCRDLECEVGDFVVLRADNTIAYQLACAVDEAAQGITEVVRGADLLGSTFRQLYVQQKLALPSPRYLHLPVLLDGSGRKLSKQNHAAAIDADNASGNLWRCLGLLGQKPPVELRAQTPAQLLQWALDHWSVGAIPATVGLQLE